MDIEYYCVDWAKMNNRPTAYDWTNDTKESIKEWRKAVDNLEIAAFNHDKKSYEFFKKKIEEKEIL